MAFATNPKITLSGNLTTDPKLNTVGEREILHITVAVNTTEKKKDEEGYITNYYEVTYTGHSRKWLAENLQKGSSVDVDGSLIISKYTKGTEERIANRVRAYSIIARSGLKPKQEEKTVEIPVDVNDDTE